MRKHDKINYLKVAFVASALLLMNVSLVSIASSEPNLVSNPDFESGTTVPSSWTFETFNGNTPIWDSIAHSGSKSIKISVPGTIDDKSGVLKSNLISVAPLTTYTLSAWVKTQNLGGSYDSANAVRVAELDSNKNGILQTPLIINDGTNDWMQIQMDFTTSASTSYVLIQANIWTGYGTMWVDDVSLSLEGTITSIPAPAQSSDDTYYVAKNGNDNNPGTEASPWLTIQKAANTAVAGDTVYVKAGTYAERLNLSNSGSAGKYITFQNYSTDIVTVSAPGGPYTVYPDHHNGLFEIIGKSYIRVKGLRFANTALGATIVIERGSNNIIIDGNIFDNITGAAATVGYNNVGGASAAWNIDVINNYVYRKGTASSPGEYAELISFDDVGYANISYNRLANQRMGECIVVKQGSEHGVVSYNNISNCYSSNGEEVPSEDYYTASNRRSQGIYIAPFSKGVKNHRVFGNILENTQGIMIGNERGGVAQRPENITVFNNIVYNGVYGVDIEPAMNLGYYPYYKDIYVYNNIAFHNRWNYDVGNVAERNINVVFRNNIAYNAFAYNFPSSNTVVTQDHNTWNLGITDPKFVDATNHNFRLQSNSPAIDAGTSIGAPSTDFDGNSRPKGGGYDIGAFEN